MRAKLAQFVQNLGVSAVSLVLCLLFLELVVFRFILVPDDLLPNISINGVVRYQPNTQATFRHPDGSATRVSVNAQGWNSTKPVYAKARTAEVKRIAVIGDSYVHGAFVDTADGFPEVIERALKRRGQKSEVFRFGMDGAPLSQYLHVLRREVRAYRPDVVVIPLIHNDFDESWRFLKTRYTSSFLKVGWDEAGRPIEIPPGDFQSGSADVLRNSATFRYLYYETNAYLHLKSLISRYFWGGDEDWSTEFISSAVDIRKIADHERNRRAARYVLAEMKRLAETDGFKLLLVMDGVREAVYSGRARSSYAVARLNEMSEELARELDLPFLDLQGPFERDYKRTGQRLEFPFDWHWNKRGNQVVGEVIAERLLEDPQLLPAVNPRAAEAPSHRPRVD